MDLKIDLSYLNEISDGDQDFVVSILSTFVEEVPKDIDHINKALEENNIAQVGKLAHKNKSTLQLLGLKNLKSLAFDIEQAAKKDASNPEIRPDAQSFVKHLSATLPVVRDTLEQINGK